MQHRWKMCPHGSFLIISFSLKSSIHMGHVLLLCFIIIVLIFFFLVWIGKTQVLNYLVKAMITVDMVIKLININLFFFPDLMQFKLYSRGNSDLYQNFINLIIQQSQLAMIKNIKLIQFYFRRGKSRRQHIPLDDNLKDLTSSQSFQQQMEKHRVRFESKMPELTLTQTLSQQKPKLEQRFKVNRKQLQQKLRKQIQKQLKIQRIIPAAEGQDFQTLQSKSFIHNQKAEIEFEQKFRGQLFKKKQTNRLIEKEKNDFRNYLDEPKNASFVEYQENLKKFKNSKIESMMNFRRNNEQLRLLIDSGYIDNPDNLGIILDKMNSTPRLEHKAQQHLKQQINAQGQRPTQSMASDLTSSQTTNFNNQLKQIAPQIQQMHTEMASNIKGPSQLRNPALLQQFFQTLQQSNEIEKQKARQDLQLMKSIKQFQLSTFQSRYDTLNFRFKGQVDFNWMKEPELLSYIKTERNVDTEPEGLLTMYMQNRDRQNKFNQPIITPTVMSRIYSVCSLYDFPETDENNRINMLNDRKFVELQKHLFMNIHQLSDESFADAVFGYCRNHKEEQGLLKLKMSERVIETMWRELDERVSSLEEEDLGLIIRSVSNTSMLRNDRMDWTHIVETLGERLPLMQLEFEFESVMSFLTMIPVSESTIVTVQENMAKFKSYTWQSKQTLQSFLQASSFVIRYKGQFSAFKGSKLIQELKLLFANKHEQVMAISDQLSINTMPQLLSMIYYFEKSKQAQAKYEIEVPNKLINKCKKLIVDNIRTQKEMIKKQTVGSVAFSMALVDYCKELSKKNESKQVELGVMQMSILKSMFSFRAIPFNSINYFTYHELTKLVNSEIVHLPLKSIAQTIFAASLVRYKNEGIMEEIMGKMVQKIYYQIKESPTQQNITHLKYTREYMLTVCSFHHSRMTNNYYYHFIQLLMESPASSLLKIEPNLLIRFFETIATLSFTTDQRYAQDFVVTEHFTKQFDICYEEILKPCLPMLTKEELIVLEYVANLFQFYKSKTLKHTQKSDSSQKYQQFAPLIDKFINHMTIEDQYLRSITQLVKNMNSLLTLQNLNQNQLNTLLPPSFPSIETQYYQHAIPTIIDQQQQIGSQFKYETVYQNVKNKLIQQNPASTIQPKVWRIQVPQKKEVYFLTTYQHLYAKYENKNITVKLFGFWKVYAEFYALKGWSFKFICTFLEG